MHKKLSPIDYKEWIGFFVTLISAMLANVAGIGGGPFYLPIGLLLFHFDAHEAIPISETIIFGSLILRMIITRKERHPFKNRPLVHYEVATMFSPSLLLGTIFGVMINRVLPSWLILILVACVMSLNFYKTSKKACQLWSDEKRHK
jgi:uncharacterized membrane protein YfcA